MPVLITNDTRDGCRRQRSIKKLHQGTVMHFPYLMVIILNAFNNWIITKSFWAFSCTMNKPQNAMTFKKKICLKTSCEIVGIIEFHRHMCRNSRNWTCNRRFYVLKLRSNHHYCRIWRNWKTSQWAIDQTASVHFGSCLSFQVSWRLWSKKLQRE